MPLAYGIGGLISVPQGPITGSGPPSTNFKGLLGQQYFDNSQSPPVEYIFNGQSWVSGGDQQAQLAGSVSPIPASQFGSVSLSSLAQLEAGTAPSGVVVPLANDVFTFVNSVVIAGGNKATEAAVGLIQEATDAQAVAGTNLNPGTPLAVQPKSLAAVFASPPAGGLGTTAPQAVVATTLGFTTMTGTLGGSWASGGTAIQIGQDASADAISIGGAGTRAITLGNSTATTNIALNTGTGSSLNLGTNAIAHTVTIGNIIGATGVAINTGTNGFALTTTGAGNVAISAGTDFVVDATGVVELNSSGGVFNIGNDAVAQNMNIGTAGARTITIGNTTAGTTIVESNGSAWTVDGITSSTYLLGPSTTTGAITIGGTAQTTGVITLGSSSATSTVKIASGAGSSTVTIAEGTAAANTVSIINGAIAAVGTVNILSGAGAAGAAGSILRMANNQRVATIDLGNVAPTAARVTTINGGASAVADTVSVLSGAQSAGTQTLNLMNGITTGGTQNVNILSAAGASTAQTLNIFNGANTTTTNTLNIAGAGATGSVVTTNLNTGAAAHVLNVGSSSAGNMTFTQASTSTFAIVGTAGTINIGTDAAANKINIGTGAAASVISIGDAAGNSGLIKISVGTGNFQMNAGTAAATMSIGSSSQTGAITIGNSTAGQVISINSGANTLTSGTNISNGAVASGTTTVNILNGNSVGGTLVCNIFGSTAATTAGTINLGTGAVAVTGHTINIGSVTGSLAVACKQTITLASGSNIGLAVDTSAGTGVAATLKATNATTDALQLITGGLKVAPTSVGAGASPQTCNNRFGQVIFSGVSIAANAVQAFEVDNTTVAGASTVVMVTMAGATTGSAPVIQSVVPAAGKFTVTVMNGNGLTTTTANITLTFWVLN